MTISSRFHEMKTKGYIKRSETLFLCINVFYKYGTFNVWKMDIKVDIFVHKINIRKLIFQLLTPRFVLLYQFPYNS